MAEITEAHVRHYAQDIASAEDIERAIVVVENLKGGELAECHVFNAALIAVAIAQARMQDRSTSDVETMDQTGGTDRQLLHRAMHRSLRLPR